MEAIIFIGIQASGKSTFYREHFFDTHIRINLDMLRTRHRENILFKACLEAKQPLVIDNTNPTITERNKYIKLVQQYKFKIIGYYFQSSLEESKQRNQVRENKQKIPVVGLIATYKKLILPSFTEGFDELYTVEISPDYSFKIKKWDK